MQTFNDWLAEYVAREKPEHIVQIGAKPGMQIARQLAPACKQYTLVSFPNEAAQLEQEINLEPCEHIRIVPGNAVELSDLVPHADIIVMNKVTLCKEPEDMTLLQNVRTNQILLSARKKYDLRHHLGEALSLAYDEFLLVARPGRVISFLTDHPEFGVPPHFVEWLRDNKRINEENIQVHEAVHGTTYAPGKIYVVTQRDTKPI